MTGPPPRGQRPPGAGGPRGSAPPRYGNTGVGPGQAPPPRYGNTGVGPGQAPPSNYGARRPYRDSAPQEERGGDQDLMNQDYDDQQPEYLGREELEGSGRGNFRDQYRDDDEEDDYGDYGHDENRGNGQEDPPRRQFKYSSANMARGPNNYRKWFCIGLMFLIFIGISVGLSIMIDKVFFKEDEDNGPEAFVFNESDHTFTRDKSYIDTACNGKTVDQDGGLKCKEACQPAHKECCEMFRPNDIEDFSTTSLTPEDDPDMANTDPSKWEPGFENCNLSTETQGCVSYAKCIASEGIDPSPAALTAYCTEPRLTEDPETCEDICRDNRCCYAQEDSLHCRADKLTVCLDYSPCQNLRIGPIVKVAPRELDQYCFYETQECEDYCKEAECCNLDHPGGSCFKENFVSCLTYAACNLSNFTKTRITVKEQFSVVPKVPKELDSACNERKNTVQEQTSQSCEQYCYEGPAACCFSPSPADNCFNDDPLGCLAWDQQCQVLKMQ